MELKIFKCAHCGNIVAMVKASGVPIMCCGQPMDELVPGTTDAAVEKHVPEYEVEGNIVKAKVGSVEHPVRICYLLYPPTITYLYLGEGGGVFEHVGHICDTTSVKGGEVQGGEGGGVAEHVEHISDTRSIKER